MNRIVIASLVQTCKSSPAQWEGETADGRIAYVRYRSGCLQVGFGDTLTDAVSDETICRLVNTEFYGHISREQLVAATDDLIDWKDTAWKVASRSDRVEGGATFNPRDRRTWPEVLRRSHLAAIWGLSTKRIDIKRQRGEMPDPLPSGHEWALAQVCEWLDNPRSRRGCRVARRVA